jgi:hypothetical protein
MDSLSAGKKPTLEGRQQQPGDILYAYFATALLFTVAGIIFAALETYGLGSIWGFSGSTLLGLWPLYLYASGLLAGIYFSKRHSDARWVTFANAIHRSFSRLRLLNWVVFALLIGLFGYLHLAGFKPLIENPPLQIFVFGHLVLLGALLLSGTGNITPIEGLLGSFSLYSLFLWVVYWVPDVQTYPLTMGWSETTWLYDASLFFSQRIYGFRVPLSTLHPSRYLLQSVPYLIPGLALWVHRLWQVLLWIGLSLAGGLALIKRINPKNLWVGLGIVAWFTLFTFQGPVYYHLMIVIIITLLGFNKQKLGLSFLWVMIASLWAGISRVNWFPVAGMLAATLYILEQPQKEQHFWHYWRWPLITALLGLLVAFSSQATYALLSGRPPEDFVSSFRSSLLFYRLLPNEAFGIGIVLMLVAASLPAVILILWHLLPARRSWRPLRLLGLLTILLALLVAGLIVSSKIGGGNNLHNLDAFMIILAVTATYILFDCFIADDPDHYAQVESPLGLILLMALIPILFVLGNLRPYVTLDFETAWETIEKVQEMTDQWVPEGGEVLFIQDRHLLTFGMIEGVKLVPEYEKVFLMEMAMSENEYYLNNFNHDIKTQRFDLIVIEPLYFYTKPTSEIFSEENNAWIISVNRPIDQTYQVIFVSHKTGLSVLVPRTTE